MQKVVSFIGRTVGVGKTVTSKVSKNLQPERPVGEEGNVDKVKIYFTIMGCEVLLVKVSLMIGMEAFAAVLLIPGTASLFHVKFVLDAKLVAA